MHSKFSETQDYETATSVTVQRPIQVVYLDCPPFMVTFEDEYCKLTVQQGTNMVMDLNYNDGDSGLTVNSAFSIAGMYKVISGMYITES